MLVMMTFLVMVNGVDHNKGIDLSICHFSEYCRIFNAILSFPMQKAIKERQLAILLQIHGELDRRSDAVQMVKEFFCHFRMHHQHIP